MIMLWTWQGVDFDPCLNRIDRSKSYFPNGQLDADLFRLAYEELDELLTLREEMKYQYLWCFTTESGDPWVNRLLWPVEVPDDAIISWVDSPLWHRLIGNQTVPTQLWNSWKQELWSLNVETYHDELKKRENEYLAACPPRDECLRRLLLPTGPGPEISALVRAPLHPSWIRPCEVKLRSRRNSRFPLRSRRTRTGT